MDLNKSRLVKRYGSKGKESWKGKGWVPFPKALIFDPKMSRSALMVFMVLHAHKFRGSKGCFPAIATIAKEARISPRMVRYALKELKDGTYLTIESGKAKGKSNLYDFDIPL